MSTISTYSLTDVDMQNLLDDAYMQFVHSMFRCGLITADKAEEAKDYAPMIAKRSWMKRVFMLWGNKQEDPGFAFALVKVK